MNDPTVIVDDLSEPPCGACGGPLLAHAIEHYVNEQRVCTACFGRARSILAQKRGVVARLLAALRGGHSKIRLRRI